MKSSSSSMQRPVLQGEDANENYYDLQ